MQREGTEQPGHDAFFEGAEKKFEVVVGDAAPELRSLGEDFWRAVVESSGAQVLSKISNERCDAYLLSESSLFVFERKAVMITCGRTRLPAAIERLLQRVAPQAIAFFIYERKNEVYPHHQPTSFYDDARELNAMLPGRAFRFGDEDEHHILLFHLDRAYRAPAPDTTIELLMYGIDDATRAQFDSTEVRDARKVRERLRFDELLSGFDIDDHLFEPGGYSLNAIRDNLYWALHVTPERNGSYVSFETNYRFEEGFERTARRLLELFDPRSFDLLVFDQGTGLRLEPEHYRLRSHVARELGCGYQVRFMSFFKPQSSVRRPHELELV
jgi:S-adenosylmethionine decarboxylase